MDPNNSLSAMDNADAITAYSKVFLAANFVGASVVSAFFTSLEQCSCINLTTSEFDSDDDDDESVSVDRRLMFSNSTRRVLPPPVPSTTAPPASVESLPV